MAEYFKNGHERPLDLSIEELKRTKDWPVLSLESTELAIGNWTVKNDTTEQLIKNMSQLNRGAIHRKLWKKIKLHASGDYLMADDFYRLDLCGYSTQLYQRHGGIHTVLFIQRHKPGDWRFGVPKLEFMKGGPDIGMRAIGRATDADRLLVKRLELRMPILPPIRFTSASDQKKQIETPTESKGNPATSALLFVRSIDWDMGVDHTLLLQCLEAHGMFTLVAHRTVPIMDQMSVIMYEVMLK